MRDFAAAVGLVFAIEGLLMAGFTESMRKRMALAAREDPAELRSASARLASASRSSGPGAPYCNNGPANLREGHIRKEVLR